jgi:hypothetical protein
VFTAVAVLSLARGIGANTAMFTLLDQILLRLLPVKDPKQLVLLTTRRVATGLVATVGLTRLVQTQLFGITPYDPGTLAVAAVCLMAVACIAGYIPAMRPLRYD